MSSIARPPDPCLVAIILVIQSRAGPRFVFHYPPNPSTVSPSNRRNSRVKSTSRSTESSHSSDEDGSSSDEEDFSAAANLRRSTSDLVLNQSDRESTSHRSSSTVPYYVASPTQQHQKRISQDSGVDRDCPSDHGNIHGDDPEPPWDTLLGLRTFVWEKLLSPSSAWHKRRFEVGLNDLAFVGWPVFVREDGTWRKRRRKKSQKERTWDGSEYGQSSKATLRDDESSVKFSELGSLSGIEEGIAEEEREKIKSDGKTKDYYDSSDGDKDAMTMFNVVFVLNPPVLEYGLRVREMYENIIKKFGKGLKLEQAKADYVWKEAKTILHLKEQARENSTFPFSFNAL